ncbi:hypothetical protein C8J30_101377 [Rhodobacter viridis]|uniref:Uncharacterized protein n=1 Tax=Rhodobacter viridis TaxID=1054202 RepID=A0A318U334_9RHOB|nr:hypothetical protein [Rhodobacter viridis]PYF12992.1 hypothetical protein C8J30_101377 [Rhodobacter viridis]
MTAELRVLARKSIGRKPGPMRDKPASVSPHPALPQLDHDLVETIMAGMKKPDRAKFWRDHVEIVGTAFMERGLSDETVQAILAEHFEQVRARNRARASDARKGKYPICFDAPPEIGTELRIGKRLARLERVEPITRKSDGAASFLLFWRIGDRLATSGLKGAGVCWVQGGDDA